VTSENGEAVPTSTIHQSASTPKFAAFPFTLPTFVRHQCKVTSALRLRPQEGRHFPYCSLLLFRIACVVPTVSWTPTSIILLWFFSCSANISRLIRALMVRGPPCVCVCATTPASLVPSTHTHPVNASALPHSRVNSRTHRTHTQVVLPGTGEIPTSSAVSGSIEANRAILSESRLWATRHSFLATPPRLCPRARCELSARV
jgi:hypothetical protein